MRKLFGQVFLHYILWLTLKHPPLTHTPLRQLADFLQKGGGGVIVFLPKLFERFCFVRAICNVNKHPPAPKGGGGAIINFVKLLKFDKVCGAKGGGDAIVLL